MCKNKMHLLPLSLLTILAAIIPYCLTSCSSDIDEDLLQNNSAKSTRLSFTLTAEDMTRAGTRTRVAGTTEENSITSCAIYLFTNEAEDGTDTYIATFKEETFSTPQDLSSYSVTEDLSDEIKEKLEEMDNGFKIVVLANWGTYPTLTEGTTTLKSICEDATNSTFTNAPTTFETVPSIPFYGVLECSDITFADKGITNLGTVSMIRAYAKIIIKGPSVTRSNNYEADLEEVSINGATIYGMNSSGYCAPLYYSDTSSGGSAVVHIPGSVSTNATISMYCQSWESSTYDSDNGETSGTGTWVAYVPEYATTTTNNYITFKLTESKANLSSIYEDAKEEYNSDHDQSVEDEFDDVLGDESDLSSFTDYINEYLADENDVKVYLTSDGKSTGTALTIKRNNIYTFKVSFKMRTIEFNFGAGGGGT